MLLVYGIHWRRWNVRIFLVTEENRSLTEAFFPAGLTAPFIIQQFLRPFPGHADRSPQRIPHCLTAPRLTTASIRQVIAITASEDLPTRGQVELSHPLEARGRSVFSFARADEPPSNPLRRQVRCDDSDREVHQLGGLPVLSNAQKRDGVAKSKNARIGPRENVEAY